MDMGGLKSKIEKMFGELKKKFGSVKIIFLNKNNLLKKKRLNGVEAKFVLKFQEMEKVFVFMIKI
jgi:hypothetical protein